jgi:NAD-dependent dihydropyrimidine dehydrogenase PreA subunit
VTAAMKYVNSDWKNYIKRMKGVTVITDPEKCEGCGSCFKVCIYDGLKLVKGKSVHTDNCIACGRCELVCPNGAISTTFDENTDIDQVVDEIIERYEKIVDISG